MTHLHALLLRCWKGIAKVLLESDAHLPTCSSCRSCALPACCCVACACPANGWSFGRTSLLVSSWRLCPADPAPCLIAPCCRLKFWKNIANYFPATLVKSCELDPKANYLCEKVWGYLCEEVWAVWEWGSATVCAYKDGWRRLIVLGMQGKL